MVICTQVIRTVTVDIVDSGSALCPIACASPAMKSGRITMAPHYRTIAFENGHEAAGKTAHNTECEFHLAITIKIANANWML